MNAILPSEQQTLELIDVIDLKWMLAHEGQYLHVERLLADPVYARRCLMLACGSNQEAVQLAARRLCERLGLDPHAKS